MINFDQWATMFPDAAQVLVQHVMTGHQPDLSFGHGASESARQQDIRMSLASQGAAVWRNNVGAIPTRQVSQCPRCQFSYEIKSDPLRYGICNDSPQINERFKSSDLIGIIPRRITPEMVGTTIGQFASIEVKERGWKYTGKGREAGQSNWITLINSKGGFACFASEPFKL